MYKHLGSTNILMYDLFIFISGLALSLFNISQFNKKKIFPGKLVNKAVLHAKEKNTKLALNIAVIIELLTLSIFQHIIPGSFNFQFGDLLNTGANYFGMLFLAPLSIATICFFSGNDIFKSFDLISVSYPIALFFAKIACFCSGCCEGIECSFGLYNYESKTVQFPSQLLEAGLAIFIFIFLLLYRKKAKEGTVFPIYLIIYSFTRFFSEFTRIEENVLWIFKTYHLLCIAGIIIGLAELYIVKKYKDKINQFFDSGYELLCIHIKSILLKTGLVKEKNIIHHKKRKKAKKIHHKK